MRRGSFDLFQTNFFRAIYACVYTTISYNNEMVLNRIGLYRAERGLSRKDLAALVGVNPQTVGFLERGSYSPSVELALKFAEVFKVPVEALFSLTPFPSLAQQLTGTKKLS